MGQRLAAAATTDERVRSGKLKAQEKIQHELELKRVIQAIKKLLSKIEDAVPLVNLAITASGANLSTNLPTTVSPSRLLQASTFLTAGDTQYSIDPSKPVQIGPTFTLSMYMLFAGHIRPRYEEDIRESTWKEVIHKANVKLMRVSLDALYSLPGEEPNGRIMNGAAERSSSPGDPRPNGSDYFPMDSRDQARADEYAYQLLIVEDLEDDRVHTFEDGVPQPGPFRDVELAGIREALPVHEVSKIFYADTGKILNIGTEGEVNSPILLLKRDVNAVPPGRMLERQSQEFIQDDGSVTPNSIQDGTKDNRHASSQSQLSRIERSQTPASTPRKGTELVAAPNPWRIPQDLDPEWLAFEVYTETPDSDLESEPSSPPAKPSRAPSLEPNLTTSLSRLHLKTPSPQPSSNFKPPTSLPPIRTSLSLLETLLRLLSLQQFQQTTHLSIPDELLTFFLSETASTGAASGDVEERKRVREEARRRVGFDPYDESPVKRRGEEYQYRDQRQQDEWAGEGEGYDGRGWTPDVTRDGSEAGYGYLSPRYDEGYGTRNLAYPSPSSPSLRQHPPLLKDKRSKSGTPVSGRGVAGTPPMRWRASESGMRTGSPLARISPGIADEGLGTSPQSDTESPHAEKGGKDEAAESNKGHDL